jgi:hypothetical protein
MASCLSGEHESMTSPEVYKVLVVYVYVGKNNHGLSPSCVTTVQSMGGRIGLGV